MVEGPVGGEERNEPAAAVSLEDAIAKGLTAGESKSRLAKRLAREYGLARSQVYDAIVRSS